MSLVSAQRSRTHSRRRLVVPSWQPVIFETSYAYGGKGNAIRRMNALGLRTPPALTIGTTLCRSYMERDELPTRLLPQLKYEINVLERQTGKQFGDPDRPLLVSVRSAGMVSMPGMLETVCNVGLTPAVARALTIEHGDEFVSDCLRHLSDGLGTRYGFVENDPWAQLYLAIEMVLRSWNSKRASEYRSHHKISDRLGTAIIIQQMVFGNRPGIKESGTGVVTSHNLETGLPGIFGGYLPHAQGPDLVSGKCTPEPVEKFCTRFPVLRNDIEEAFRVLNRELEFPAEIEVTVENGILYVLQFRKAKLSPNGLVGYYVHEKERGRMTREEVIDAVPGTLLSELKTAAISDPAGLDVKKRVASGTGISGGAVVGAVACTEKRAQELIAKNEPFVLVRKTTVPDDFSLMLKAVGIVTVEGGTTCHAAVVARGLGKPAVIGITPKAYERIVTTGGTITIDAYAGNVWPRALNLRPASPTRAVQLLARWRNTFDGKPSIRAQRCLESHDVHEALNNFYLCEAMLAACSDKSLSATIRARRNWLINTLAEVFSTYLVLAVTSEVTHAASKSGKTGHQGLNALRNQYSLDHRTSWRPGSVPVVAQEMEAATPEMVIAFFRDCATIFRDFTTGGYGGPKWADIAEAVELFFAGTVSAEVFVDRVFDLKHNGGPAFDKHRMLTCNNGVLGIQLDIKRKELDVGSKYRELLRAAPQKISWEIGELYQAGKEKGLWT